MIAQKKPKSVLGTAIYHKRNGLEAHISHLCTLSYLLEQFFLPIPLLQISQIL